MPITSSAIKKKIVFKTKIIRFNKNIPEKNTLSEKKSKNIKLQDFFKIFIQENLITVLKKILNTEITVTVKNIFISGNIHKQMFKINKPEIINHLFTHSVSQEFFQTEMNLPNHFYLIMNFKINIKLREQKMMTFFDNKTEINLINERHAQILNFFYTVSNYLRLINMNDHITTIFGICENEKIFINPVKIKQLFLIIRYAN